MGVIIPQVLTEDRVSGAQIVDGGLRFGGITPKHYLIRNYTNAGNRKTFTFSCWTKRNSFGNGSYEPTLFSTGTSGSNPRATIRFTTGNALEIGFNPTG